MADFTDLIAQMMRIAKRDVRFFAQAVRQITGHNLRYRQIWHSLQHGKWTGNELDAFSKQAQAFKEAHDTHMAIAAALAIYPTEVPEFMSGVRQKIQFSVSDKEILAAIQGLAEPGRTERNILAALEVGRIARKLGVENAEVDQLASTLSERLGVPVTNYRVLNAIDAATSTPTVETVIEDIESDAKLILSIADDLDETPEDASLFVDHLQERYPWATKVHILQAIRHLEVTDRRVNSIHESVEVLFIARKAEIEYAEARTLAAEISEQTGFAVTNALLIKTLSQPEFEINENVIERLFMLGLVAQARRESWQAARLFVQAIMSEIQPVRYHQLERAFAALSFPYTVAEFVAQLESDQAMQHLDVSLADLTKRVADLIGSDIPAERVFRVVQSLGEGATSETVLAHFEEEFASILMIASEMEIPPAAVRETLHKIAVAFEHTITEGAVIRSLQQIDNRPKTIPQVVDELYLQRIVGEMNIPLPRARSLVARLQQVVDHRLTSKSILQKITEMERANRDVETLEVMLQLCNALKLRIPEVHPLLDSLQKETNQFLSATKLWTILKHIDPVHHHHEGIAAYLLIANRLKAGNTKAATVNKAVAWLGENKAAVNRFWSLLEQFRRGQKITESDLAYIFKIAIWPASSVAIMSPNLSRKEQWIHQGIVDSLVSNAFPEGSFFQRWLNPNRSQNEQNRQVVSLKAYGRQCWRTIRSDERRYQVPSNGRAEIIVDEKLRSLIGLHSLQFVQERISAPGLFIRFKLREPAAVGLVCISETGTVEGFQELSNNQWFQALIEAVAFGYYRDLVISGESEYRENDGVIRSRRGGGGKSVARAKKPHRTLPSPRTHKRASQGFYRLEDWYESQEIMRHWVRGHVREVGPHFEASPEKQREAKRAGVRLKPGQTWVVEHERGNPQDHMIVKLDGEDLIEHTVFAPPVRATTELKQILM
jgi:hypothetical protein